MTRLELLAEQIRWTRQYTCMYLERVDDADWFRVPAGCPTHIAWQVGHLAVAGYGLGIQRIRAPQAEDLGLFPDGFQERFARGTTATADAGACPPVPVIRAVFDRVHERVLAGLATLSDAELDQPPLAYHDLFNTRLGSLSWLARHEMLHVGKIGLIRRLLGAPPIR